MKPNSVIARKTIIDHMKKNDLKLHNLFLSSKLIRRVKAARTWCSEFLKEHYENEIEKKKATQLEIIQVEISEARLRQNQYKKMCKSLDEEFVELMKAAQQENNIKLVIKHNRLKRKSEEKLKEIKTLSNAIAALEEKRLKFKYICTQLLNGLISLGFYKLLDLPY